MTRPPIVIGIGNPDRGDDAVGVRVARQVAAEHLHILTLELDDPSEALDAWDPEDTVIVADAITSGGAPGDIHVVDVIEHRLPEGSWSAMGTHAFGLAAIVELARSLDLMPRRLVVVGVEAAQFTHGAPLSDAVLAALPAATDAVLTAIKHPTGSALMCLGTVGQVSTVGPGRSVQVRAGGRQITASLLALSDRLEPAQVCSLRHDTATQIAAVNQAPPPSWPDGGRAAAVRLVREG